MVFVCLEGSEEKEERREGSGRKEGREGRVEGRMGREGWKE